MNYRIETREKFSSVGFSAKQPMTLAREEIKEGIPQEWRAFKESKAFKLMERQSSELGVMGIGYDYDFEKKEFSFMVGIEGDEIKGVSDTVVLSVEESNWAVFESIGALPKAIQDTWHRIYSEWFPSTRYEQADLPTLEVHMGKDITSDLYKAEIWVPIK